MNILKFGGSSIADADKIRHVAGIIEGRKNNSELAIVISAFGGVTDTIKTLAEYAAVGKNIDATFDSLVAKHTECAEKLSINNEMNIRRILDEYFTQLKSDLLFVAKESHLSSQSLDKVLSYGELLSTKILAEYLCQIGIPAEQLDARKVILTDNYFGHAFVHYQESYNRIRSYYKDRSYIQIITGFLGSTKTGATTTLGRSGSDYTAAIFGAALNAEIIEIWTDVSGILSADPKIINEAEVVSNLTYEEAMELAHAGAKVIFPPTMIPALYKNIPIVIKNTFKPDHPGSTIAKDRAKTDKSVVGISSLSNVALVRLQGAGMVGMKGINGRTFSSLANGNINIILVSQAFSEHSICFAIKPEWITKAVKTLETEFALELKNHYIDKITVEKNLSLVAVVGEGMRHMSGVSSRVFSTLGNKNINVIAIAQGSSERNISFIVNDKDVNQTLKSLHSEFFDKKDHIADIYLLGVGTVGSELLDIIGKEIPRGISIRSVGSSKKMVIENNGVNPIMAKDELNKSGIPLELNEFFDKNGGKAKKQKIFIDCTASETIAKEYVNILGQGFSVVTANKIANTLDQNYYYSIRDTAKNNNVQFKYQTNVGAGLPIISTLQGLIATGDNILSIEGVLSGTLSYLFNSFDGQKPFSALVRDAREKGFTEPDPREDLSGIDVARKMLILARETGAKLELDDIFVESLIPTALDPTLSVNTFLDRMVDFDQLFIEKLKNATAKQKVLRYIGKWDGQKAKVGLEMVSNDNPFYYQNGRENFIVFRSKRYNDVPLVIKGHGAGAAVTAAGVLHDIQLCLKNR
tara:strand:+ start:640 stop:3063 length:2424 start_codon:yes stop_codon:yes gene_type:complete